MNRKTIGWAALIAWAIVSLGLLIYSVVASSAEPPPSVLVVTQPHNPVPVVEIYSDGRIFWNGREVKTEVEYRIAMRALIVTWKQSCNAPNP